ncbi:MAG: hypothetical protein ABSA46_06540 [Thermodesulfovibrionales bacterium]|jgi:threonine synthase
MAMSKAAEARLVAEIYASTGNPSASAASIEGAAKVNADMGAISKVREEIL